MWFVFFEWLLCLLWEECVGRDNFGSQEPSYEAGSKNEAGEVLAWSRFSMDVKKGEWIQDKF